MSYHDFKIVDKNHISINFHTLKLSSKQFMANENQSRIQIVSTYIQVVFQISIALSAVLISYLAWNTDVNYKNRQEAISLIDRSQKLDAILSEMYELVKDASDLRNEITTHELRILHKYSVLFEPESDRELRAKVISLADGHEEQLKEKYKRITHLIGFLRMKYGIYFPILEQHFLGASSSYMVAPTEEYDAWYKLTNKMITDSGNLSYLDFCVNALGSEAILISNAHIEACDHLNIEKLNFGLGDEVPILSALQQIIRVNGMLLQTYADEQFRLRHKAP